jgi:putative membrane protein
MLHANDRFSEAVARHVADIEAKTDAEVVVVAAERSGSYRDVSMALAFVAALLVFAVLEGLRWTVHPVLALVEILLSFGLVTWLAEGHPLPVRLAPRERRSRQVMEAAAATFHLDGVHATPSRIGVLVYVSAAERIVELIPDVGLRQRMPDEEWQRLASGFDATELDGFLRGLDAVGNALATIAPGTDAPAESLPDAPRLRNPR